MINDDIPDPPPWVKKKGKEEIDKWNEYWLKQAGIMKDEKTQEALKNDDPRDRRSV